MSRTDDTFIGVPFCLLGRTDLDATGKLLYGYLRYRQGNNGASWWSHSAMSRELGVSARTTKRAVARLQALGLIAVKRSVGRRNTNSYAVCDPAEKVSDCHHLEAEKGVKMTPEKVALCPGKGVKVSPKKKNGKAKEKEDPVLSDFFDLFWQLYPQHRRVNRDECIRKWNEAVDPDDSATATQIVDGLKVWLISNDWTKEGGMWVPKAAKFLRERKWTMRPVNTGPEPRPCYRCGGPAANYSHDDGGAVYWFCRRCQPRVRGKLERDVPTR